MISQNPCWLFFCHADLEKQELPRQREGLGSILGVKDQNEDPIAPVPTQQGPW